MHVRAHAYVEKVHCPDEQRYTEREENPLFNVKIPQGRSSRLKAIHLQVTYPEKKKLAENEEYANAPSLNVRRKRKTGILLAGQSEKSISPSPSSPLDFFLPAVEQVAHRASMEPVSKESSAPLPSYRELLFHFTSIPPVDLAPWRRAAIRGKAWLVRTILDEQSNRPAFVPPESRSSRRHVPSETEFEYCRG
ncbi:hypothetical protein KM043_018457 [Ampulex compressa]|nr:hypothetical protein KM043_018457 [Ampulex compressa]